MQALDIKSRGRLKKYKTLAKENSVSLPKEGGNFLKKEVRNFVAP